MKHKLKIILGFTILFLLISVVVKVTAKAQSGEFLLYFPAIKFDYYSPWKEVGPGSASGGGISDNSFDSRNPFIAIAADGTPYITWTDAGVYVRAWNGSSWEEVGAGSATGGGISGAYGQFPKLAIAPDGTIYATWQDRRSASNGDLNNTLLSDLSVQTPGMAPDGVPGVNEIYLRAWNGSSWEEVGTGSASGGGISNSTLPDSVNPSLATAPDGTPYVAWSEEIFGPASGGFEIYIRVWDGSSWAEVGTGSASGGGISNTPAISRDPSLAIAPNGVPYVAWSDYNSTGGNKEIYIRTWNGSSWAEVGAGSASGGGISNTPGNSNNPSLAIASDGTPYVAWSDYDLFTGNTLIYLRAWNGNSWAEVGQGSASGGGISNNSGYSHSYNPSLAIGPGGSPYVAWWYYPLSELPEIYVRAWNGSSWAEVGAGSANGGGISNYQGMSEYPSLAIAPDGTPYVAWKHLDFNSDDEIFVRRHIE